jgi:Holliday junction resolvase
MIKTLIKKVRNVGRMARNKGKRGEREIVKILQAHGWQARRGYQARGGKEEPDVVSNFPYRIEVKFVENLNIFSAFDQILFDNPHNCDNVLAFRKSNEPWRVALDLEVFLRLVKH